MSSPIEHSCLAARCAEMVTGTRRVCERHWKALPGKLRSQLSISAHFPRSSVTEDLWKQAESALIDGAKAQ